MSQTVAEMSVGELRQLVGELLEEKLVELLGDPDEGLELRVEVRERLLRQQAAVAAGERGAPLEVVRDRLGL